MQLKTRGIDPTAFGVIVNGTSLQDQRNGNDDLFKSVDSIANGV